MIKFKKEEVKLSDIEAQKYAIKVKNLTKSFKKKIAVDDIDMEINKGKIHGFIGPNGSGKTTTIKSIVGAVVPSKGHIFINGLDSQNVEVKKEIGYIPENAKFPKHLSVFKYLFEMGILHGLSFKDSKEKTIKIIQTFKLEELKRKNPNKLSSGQKKKILLAQALINNPSILVLDEPAANLDPDARNQLFSDLKRLRDMGKTILISSHILTELQDIVDEITILNSSKLIYKGEIITEAMGYYELTIAEKNYMHILIDVIEGQNYKILEYDELNAIVHLPNRKDDVYKLTKVLQNSGITIVNIQPHTTNLPELYQKLLNKYNLETDEGSLASI